VTLHALTMMVIVLLGCGLVPKKRFAANRNFPRMTSGSGGQLRITGPKPVRPAIKPATARVRENFA
jgi:hypothetical protein